MRAESAPQPVQLTVRVPLGAAEELEAVLWGGLAWAGPGSGGARAGGTGSGDPPGSVWPDGVEERPAGDQASLWVISWIDPPPAEALDRLARAMQARGAVVVARAAVAADEGVDAWQAWARPWRAGPFVVRPPWLDPPPEGPRAGTDGRDLEIDPGAMFGSGSHQSTRMALELLVTLVEAGDALVDVGSGSGILGVAGALLGAAEVQLVELDPQGEQAGLANAARNGVADRVRWAGTDAFALTPPAAGGRRLVVANLLIGEHEALAPALRSLAGAGGTLVLAGVLERQVSRLLAGLGPTAPVATRLEPSETDPSVSWAALAVRVAGDVTAPPGDTAPPGETAPCG
ncbi:MAG: 50S ribosomal protein L11 methyltransferase [Microthrixaceae bacterium]